MKCAGRPHQLPVVHFTFGVATSRAAYDPRKESVPIWDGADTELVRHLKCQLPGAPDVAQTGTVRLAGMARTDAFPGLK